MENENMSNYEGCGVGGCPSSTEAYSDLCADCQRMQTERTYHDGCNVHDEFDGGCESGGCRYASDCCDDNAKSPTRYYRDTNSFFCPLCRAVWDAEMRFDEASGEWVSGIPRMRDVSRMVRDAYYYECAEFVVAEAGHEFPVGRENGYAYDDYRREVRADSIRATADENGRIT